MVNVVMSDITAYNLFNTNYKYKTLNGLYINNLY